MDAIDKVLLDEQSKVPKLKIMFGDWWAHYAPPAEFMQTLYGERDRCPYCDGELGPLSALSEGSPVSIQDSAHLDHMDPLSKGGEDSVRNVVYVCGPCNVRKGTRLFIDWLSTLPSALQDVSRAIYAEKHGHEPEAFNPGPSQSRHNVPFIALKFDERTLRQIYPRPIVTGPPRRNLSAWGL